MITSASCAKRVFTVVFWTRGEETVPFPESRRRAISRKAKFEMQWKDLSPTSRIFMGIIEWGMWTSSGTRFILLFSASFTTFGEALSLWPLKVRERYVYWSKNRNKNQISQHWNDETLTLFMEKPAIIGNSLCFTARWILTNDVKIKPKQKNRLIQRFLIMIYNFFYAF